MTDFLDRVSPTGIRCDKRECGAMVRGETDTRDQLRALTAHAESLGWQCDLVEGKPCHLCPQHRSTP